MIYAGTGGVCRLLVVTGTVRTIIRDDKQYEYNRNNVIIGDAAHVCMCLCTGGDLIARVFGLRIPRRDEDRY